MDQKLVGRYFTTQSLLHAVFLAVESYGLSYIIWALLPKFWAFAGLLEFLISIIAAYFIADFIFNQQAASRHCDDCSYLRRLSTTADFVALCSLSLV